MDIRNSERYNRMWSKVKTQNTSFEKLLSLDQDLEVTVDTEPEFKDKVMVKTLGVSKLRSKLKAV